VGFELAAAADDANDFCRIWTPSFLVLVRVFVPSKSPALRADLAGLLTGEEDVDADDSDEGSGAAAGAAAADVFEGRNGDDGCGEVVTAAGGDVAGDMDEERSRGFGGSTGLTAAACANVGRGVTSDAAAPAADP